MILKQHTKAKERDFGGVPRPTLENWLTAPSNRWSFRHVRELFPTARISSSPRGTLGVRSYDGVLTPETIQFLEKSYTDAFVVLQDGELAAEWYAPGVSVDDRHLMFSVTKSVIGVVASTLIAEGQLDETALVTDYIPEACEGGYATATVRHLLNMTAAVNFREDYEGTDHHRYREAIGMIPATGTREGIHKFIVGLPESGAHGEAFNYVSPTAELATWVCERVTGQSFASLVSRYVWRPMGAEHDADLLLDPHGGSRGSGGLNATARDIARFGQLLIDPIGGALGRGIADLKKRGNREEWVNGNLRDFLPNGLYRSFWYQFVDAPDVYLAAGIHGQRVYVDTEHRTVIVQQASLPAAADDATWQRAMGLFPEIVNKVS